MKENEMIHTGRVLIVEGKYDAARLSHLTDAMILLTDGFGIYSDKKRQQLFKALAQKNGLILLTDSDAAGFRIRTYITNLVGEKNVVQAYVPAIHGKEKRKEQPGKEQIDALQAKAEAEEMAVSMQEAPDFESEELPDLLPDEMPDAEPSPEPLIIPMDPDIEPDTRMPEEMKTAA